jgi:hypothetical protein
MEDDRGDWPANLATGNGETHCERIGDVVAGKDWDYKMKIYTDRVTKAQMLMSEAGADLVALSLGSNMRYLSGFTDEPGERLLLLLIPREGNPVFIVPEL